VVGSGRGTAYNSCTIPSREATCPAGTHLCWLGWCGAQVHALCGFRADHSGACYRMQGWRDDVLGRGEEGGAVGGLGGRFEDYTDRYDSGLILPCIHVLHIVKNFAKSLNNLFFMRFAQSVFKNF